MSVILFFFVLREYSCKIFVLSRYIFGECSLSVGRTGLQGSLNDVI